MRYTPVTFGRCAVSLVPAPAAIGSATWLKHDRQPLGALQRRLQRRRREGDEQIGDVADARRRPGRSPSPCPPARCGSIFSKSRPSTSPDSLRPSRTPCSASSTSSTWFSWIRLRRHFFVSGRASAATDAPRAALRWTPVASTTTLGLGEQRVGDPPRFLETLEDVGVDREIRRHRGRGRRGPGSSSCRRRRESSAASAPPSRPTSVEVRARVEQRAAIGLAGQHGEDRHALSAWPSSITVLIAAMTVLSPPTQIACASRPIERSHASPTADVLSTFASSSVKPIVFATSRASTTNTQRVRLGGIPGDADALQAGQHRAARAGTPVRPAETSSGRPCRADASAGCARSRPTPDANGSATSVKRWRTWPSRLLFATACSDGVLDVMTRS